MNTETIWFFVVAEENHTQLLIIEIIIILFRWSADGICADWRGDGAGGIS